MQTFRTRANPIGRARSLGTLAVAAGLAAVLAAGGAGCAKDAVGTATTGGPGSTGTSTPPAAAPATGTATPGTNPHTTVPAAPDSSNPSTLPFPTSGVTATATVPTIVAPIPRPAPAPTPPPTASTGPTVSLTLPTTTPGTTDCGIVYLATGWPTTPAPNPSFYTCLKAGWVAGTPTRLVERAQTDGFGGAILVTTYDVLGPGSVRVTEDATNAADRPQVITVRTCTVLEVQMIDVSVANCTP